MLSEDEIRSELRFQERILADQKEERFSDSDIAFTQGQIMAIKRILEFRNEPIVMFDDDKSIMRRL